MSKKIAVVGAGITGLTAAYYLKKFGYSVTVYEASHQVGGRMSSEWVQGHLMDRGAQFLSSDYSTLLPLLQELGMSSEIVKTSQWVGMVKHQKIRKISVEHFLSPITSGYLSWKEAFLFLLKLKQWQPTLNALPLDDSAPWSDFDDEYADQFIRRIFGENILEYMIEPQMQGLHYQSPEEVSKVHALMLLAFTLKRGKTLNLEGGMGSLPAKLATFVEVKFNCPIVSIETTPSGDIAFKTESKEFFADRVIIATPADVAASLLPAEYTKNPLLKTPYRSTLNINIADSPTWELPRDLKKLYGILIPRSERQIIAGIGIESNKGRKESGQGELLDIMLDSKHGERLLNETDATILKNIAPELERYFPGFLKAMSFCYITRWEKAEPVSYLGKSRDIKKYRESLSPTERILLAGDYMGFPYTDSAAFTGKWAAEFIRHADREN